MSRQNGHYLKIHENDNVVVAINALSPGDTVAGVAVTAKIPAGHKAALTALAVGEPVIKYGQTIGRTTAPIQPGDHVHTHNLAMADFTRNYAIGEEVRDVSVYPEGQRRTFQGIVREDGRVATRNYIGILCTVSCAASVGQAVARRFEGADFHDRFPRVDGVVNLPHTTGCGMSITGEGYRYLQRCLAGYANHPNFAGVLILALGCEIHQLSALVDNMGLDVGDRIQTLTIQELGGTKATVDRGAGIVQEMAQAASAARRQTVSAEHIVLALECGGSDAYSGITANPALGAAADLLVRNGGTGILSETPEIYGAEHLLTRRATDPAVAEKLIDRIKWWEQYTQKHGASIDNNPAPGNKAGGITTILEKSLGAAAKGGTTNLVEVYGYAEPVTKKGFVFMDTPGYDMPSITGMVAGGANVVCFTTGCGTVYGCKPVPVVKIATNTAMYTKIEGDMDVNAGVIADGTATMESVGEQIFEKVLQTASGVRSHSETLGFGELEFVPWHIGAVL